MYLTVEGLPVRSKPFETLPITSEPKNAAHTLPRPPKRLTPPMTAAAIASSRSVPPPIVVSAASRFETATSPPTEANVADSTNTVKRMRRTLTPARRAPFALPPTAYRYRPNGVCWLIHAKMVTRPMKRIAAVGTPPQEPSTAVPPMITAATTASCTPLPSALSLVSPARR